TSRSPAIRSGSVRAPPSTSVWRCSHYPCVCRSRRIDRVVRGPLRDRSTSECGKISRGRARFMSGDVSELMDEDNWYSLVSVLSAGTGSLMLGRTPVTGTLDGEHLPVQVAMATYIKQRRPEDLREQLGSRFERLDP